MTYNCASRGTCDPILSGPRLADVCGASAFIIFMSILDELIRSNNKISGRCEQIQSIKEPAVEYDFVIIGGGGAGAVVAARLSENPQWKILLVECGANAPSIAQVPAFPGLLMKSVVDWNQTTTNESFACLATNGSCSLPTGKMLGGGTGRNGMIYNRGVPADYNNWARRGNKGWTWEDVKPYYLLAEDNGEIERVGRLYHATGGPLSVERFPNLPPFSQSLLAAAREKGHIISEDLNGKRIMGFSIVQTTSKNGVRRSSAAAYLQPIRKRKNLHISLDSCATRVIIQNNQAVGVEYNKNGRLRKVNVLKEVVVSAGTLGSPKLLHLSGIGPRKDLEAVGVKVVRNLPGVGENFHDHPCYILNFTFDDPDKYDNGWVAAAQYLKNQTGPLSGRGLASVMATLVTKAARSDSPDLQIQFNGYNAGCAPGEVDALRTTGKRTVGVRINNIHPESRGRVSLASNDPLDGPLVWGNYLCETRDVDVLLYGIKVVRALADTRALRAHKFTLSTPPTEACSNYTFLSPEYWTCLIRQGAGVSSHHPVGTCKMGPASDSMAVVNPRLQVHGIKGLRVVDASIMPQVTSGNTAAPTMMIGERGADFIKEYHGFTTQIKRKGYH